MRPSLTQDFRSSCALPSSRGSAAMEERFEGIKPVNVTDIQAKRPAHEGDFWNAIAMALGEERDRRRTGEIILPDDDDQIRLE